MAIEIVDLPIYPEKMVMFHSLLYVYQAGYQVLNTPKNKTHRYPSSFSARIPHVCNVSVKDGVTYVKAAQPAGAAGF